MNPNPEREHVQRNRVAKRLMLHDLLEEHPGTEEAMSKMAGGRYGFQRQQSHANEIRLAHHQHAAQQDPWVQDSMLRELVSPNNVGQRTLMVNPDAMPDFDQSMQELGVAHAAHEQRFGTGARPKPMNLAHSQFGGLGDTYTEEAMKQPHKMLPEGVIPTGKWTGR